MRPMHEIGDDRENQIRDKCDTVVKRQLRNDIRGQQDVDGRMNVEAGPVHGFYPSRFATAFAVRFWAP